MGQVHFCCKGVIFHQNKYENPWLFNLPIPSLCKISEFVNFLWKLFCVQLWHVPVFLQKIVENFPFSTAAMCWWWHARFWHDRHILWGHSLTPWYAAENSPYPMHNREHITKTNEWSKTPWIYYSFFNETNFILAIKKAILYV